MEEDDWVVDCLIGYLSSPLWRNPVDDFIEQHCIVFDEPGSDDPSHAEIHADYQSMVEELMNGFTTDVGISWEQLSDACTKSRNLRREHRTLFQPLLASEQLSLFMKIMHQRNVILERQALQLLQKQLGQNPESYQGTSQESRPMSAETVQAAREEKMLQEVLEMSKRDYEKKKQEEDEDMERLVAQAKEESLKMFRGLSVEDESSGGGHVTGIATGNDQKNSEKKESDKLPSLVTKKSLGSVSGEDSVTINIPLATKVSGGLEANGDGVSGAEAAELWLQSARLEATESTSSDAQTVQIPEDPIAREKYLKYQRDRLLESKRKVRADELKVFKASGKPFASKSSWKPVNTSSIKTHQTGSYRKITDESEEGDFNTEKLPATEGRAGKGGIIKKTGVLCTAIANKMKAGGTDL